MTLLYRPSLLNGAPRLLREFGRTASPWSGLGHLLDQEVRHPISQVFRGVREIIEANVFGEERRRNVLRLEPVNPGAVAAVVDADNGSREHITVPVLVRDHEALAVGAPDNFVDLGRVRPSVAGHVRYFERVTRRFWPRSS